MVYLNGTALPHDDAAHEQEAVAADLRDRLPSEPHYHAPPDVVARARVSEIARQNGILIEGITDGEGGHGMGVRALHEVTLAAEIPVAIGDVGAYDLVGKGESVAPWGCWPRLGGEALPP